MKDLIWYHSLRQPVLSPPDWVFAPVWAVLYIMIFVSFLLFLKSGKFSLMDKAVPIVIFALQMILNLSWSPVFFSLHNIAAAFIIICVLWVCILAIILLFWKHSKISALILVPYFLWTTFALYLNFEILKIN